MGIELAQSFNVITCGKCGVTFAVPERFDEARRADKETFYCPNGHPRAYVKSPVDALREQLEKAQAQLRHSANREAAVAQELEKERRAKKRLAKRLDAGVCPVAGCKRHFTNLQRHIQTEHAGCAIPAGNQQKAIEAGRVQ